MKIFASVVVWGSEYTHTFLNFNLPILTRHLFLLKEGFSELSFFIYTYEEYYDLIIDNEYYKTASKCFQLFVFCLGSEAAAESNCYSQMHDAHKKFIAHAQSEQAGMIFLAPDAWFSKQTFVLLGNIIRLEKRAMLLAAPRVEKEYGLDYLIQNKQRFFSEGMETQDIITPILNRPHMITQAFCVDENQSTSVSWPSTLYWWREDNAGFIIRSFHLHPLYVHPRAENLAVNFTIDFDLIERSGLTEDDIYIPSDSTEACGFELSTARRQHNGVSRPLVAHDLLNFVKSSYATPRHCQNILHRIYYHKYDDLNSSSWKKLTDKSDAMIEEFQTLLSKRGEEEEEKIPESDKIPQNEKVLENEKILEKNSPFRRWWELLSFPFSRMLKP